MLRRSKSYEDVMDFLGQDNDEVDTVPGMTRINYKAKMFRDLLKINSDISSKEGSSGKRVCNFLKKSLLKDVKKGIEVLNKKIPIYVELPKFTPVSDGQVRKVYDTSDTSSQDDEIEVTVPDISRK